MNEFDEPKSDAELNELLEPLRSIGVPDAVRRANLNAVSSALAHRNEPHWWQRSVSVPLPLALAAGIALVATTIAIMFQSANLRTAAGEPAPTVVIDQLPPGKWTITRSYIGTLQSLAMPQAPADFDTTENRDDS
jgi:hypothetical protein